jgi:hypothetical protein
MIGASYVGTTQWLPAAEDPPGLGAIAPIVTAADYRDGWVYRGGAFELGFSLQWTLSLCVDAATRRVADGTGPADLVERVRDAQDRIESLYGGLDAETAGLLRTLAPWYDDWRAHPDRDAAWPSIAPDLRPGSTVAPALDSFSARAMALDLTAAYGRRQASARGVAYFFPRPSKGSACKRLNLFLRWMVRRDALDLGQRLARLDLVDPLHGEVVDPEVAIAVGLEAHAVGVEDVDPAARIFLAHFDQAGTDGEELVAFLALADDGGPGREARGSRQAASACRRSREGGAGAQPPAANPHGGGRQETARHRPHHRLVGAVGCSAADGAVAERELHE